MSLAAETGTCHGIFPVSAYQARVPSCHHHNDPVMAHKRLVFLGLFVLALELIVSPFSLARSVKPPDLDALKHECCGFKKRI